MTTFHHGVRVTETTDLGDAINDIDSSVIGVVCTADDADTTAFPLNTPVLITRVASVLGKAGKSGTLLSTLTAISNQCSPRIVVVRVAEAENVTPDASDDDPPTQDALVIGGQDESGRYTGMYAFLSAVQRVGVKPRILAAPGLDTLNVATQLAVFAKKLRAFGYVSAHGCTSVAEAKAYAADFSARELMVIWPDFEAYDPATGKTAVLPAPAVAVGLRAAIDASVGWHKSLSNVAVNGVTGITYDVYYSLQDTDSDTDDLNSAHVTTLIKRDGFRFWGNRTCDTETFVYEVYTRTAQTLADTVAEAHAKYVDGPLTPSYAKAVVDGVNQKLSALTTAGQLLGGKAWYDTADNGKDELRQGKITISYNYTPVPPAEDFEFIQDFTDTYFDVFDALSTSGS
ncbi:phage tail sheath subtilisin-like domain-containing protein [Serratia marcescens]|uniref:phage tail sheath subtilisin-like domain-containing protein n=1 Tax=Serratia marcescens TaxID=615 RepID=UPI0024C49CB1|nr:phage tail sheath subtilisin-like domain-containing protein [Serratia marcescens]MDK1706999.1 phage tail sheath subtilisin-like domain-containing protein [Serratia marcescens]